MSDQAVAVQKQATAREFKSIQIEMEDSETGRTRKMRFDGDWLVGDESRGEEHHYGRNDGGGKYSVALSKNENIVVFRFDANETIVESNNFDSFEDLQDEEGIPQSLVSAVAEELGVEYVEEMDV